MYGRGPACAVRRLRSALSKRIIENNDRRGAVMSERYPIIWLTASIRDGNHKKGSRCYAGFCGKTNMLYHVSSGLLEPLTVHDFIVSKDGRCEEEKGCLNQSCPLNRTT